ncbi:MAG: GNAT family protein [Cyanobacteriota bacterium]
MILIETNRLRLKKYEIKDAEIMFNSLQKNLKHLSEVLVKPVKDLKNISDTEKLINLINVFWKKNERFIIPLWLKNSDLLVGECYIGAFNSEKTEAEIGYLLFKEFEGKGFAYEATMALIKTSFEKLKLKKIWLKCDSDNFRSIKLANKCNFILKNQKIKQLRKKADNTEIETLTFFLDAE